MCVMPTLHKSHCASMSATNHYGDGLACICLLVIGGFVIIELWGPLKGCVVQLLTKEESKKLYSKFCRTLFSNI